MVADPLEDRVALLDCEVAFKKNWQRDQNQTSAFRVTKKDMDEIRVKLAGEDPIEATFSVPERRPRKNTAQPPSRRTSRVRASARSPTSKRRASATG